MGFYRKVSNPADITILKITPNTLAPPKGQRVVPVYHTRFNELIDYVGELEFELTGDVLRNLFDGTTGSLYQTGGNVSDGHYNAVLGYGNTAAGDYNLIGGSGNNVTTDEHFNLVAGLANAVDGDYNSVAGRSNSVLGDYNLAAGYINEIAAGENYNVVAGRDNYIDGDYCTVLGQTLTATHDYNFIHGTNISVSSTHNLVKGYLNTVDGTYHGVVGRELTVAVGSNYGLLCGYQNHIDGDGNAVMGTGSTAAGDGNVVGGRGHNVSGNYSFAVGNSHVIDADSQAAFGNGTDCSSEAHGVAFASGINATTGDAQHELTHFYADIVSTGAATATSHIYAGGTNEIEVATGAINRVDVWWAAIQYAGDSGPTGTIQSAHEFALIHNATGTTVFTDGGSTDPVPAADWGTFGFAAAGGKWHGTFTIAGDRDVKLSAKVQIVKVGI